ncbi:recombinase family protein [Streptomyces microflavus]|uniref:recombinase family protein n=1 Tax=Streptomyces microflavus TaxID=1919 RepID=UPI0033AF8C2F
MEEHKTEIATVKAGDLDLSTPTGRLIARMLGAIAKYEVDHRQERILHKVEELVAAGKRHNGGIRAFGYDLVFDAKSKIIDRSSTSSRPRTWSAGRTGL